MENFKSPVPVEWSARRVLTTAQLAECYKCTSKQIKQNFNHNRDRFIEGKHYFKIEGEALNNLRVDIIDLQISPKTRTLYLWTERGAARHAKMLSTEKAWEVFEELEDFYFTHNTPNVAPAPNPARRESQLKPARVYLLEMSDNTVKVGYSSNVITRTSKIEREVKMKATQIYFTPLMSREDARLVEWAFKKNYSSQRIKGEFFSVAFAEAFAAVNFLVNRITTCIKN